MAQKYTILKVLIRNSNKGFTLLELLVGLIIMSVVGGMAMSAFVNTSTSFQKDKKNIDSNQNLSAILDIIGTDIRQAGEGINDGNFPTIEFGLDSANTTASTAANTINPQASSKITIRKSVSPQLTLCQDIPGDGTALPNIINVADTGSANTNCKFTAAAPTLFPPSGVTTSPFNTLISTREYRCQLDQLNSSYLSVTSDQCSTASSTSSEVLRAVLSDGKGHIRTFNYYDDNFDVNTSPTQYYIKTGMTTSDPTDIDRNKTVPYPPGSPIYLIEEKVYALDNSGNLTLSINGGTPQTLSTGIAQFNISARLYTNPLDQVVNPKPTVPATTAASGSTPATTTISSSAFVCPTGTNYPNQPTTSGTTEATLTNPQYVCQFNYNTQATDVAMNWKTIAGVKISLQAKYDSTGQSATITASNSTPQELNRRSVAAEYFPRNVLSK
jgi:prepilin-type N-terminal cleavage/methylation domain-containing protein